MLYMYVYQYCLCVYNLMQDPYIAHNYTVEVIHPSPIENDKKHWIYLINICNYKAHRCLLLQCEHYDMKW